MRTNSDVANMKHFVLQDKIVRNKKDENIKGRIAAAAGCIPVSLQRHEWLKWWIKKIHQVKNCGPYFFMNSFHLVCENKTYLPA
jgi:hypothetical protein